MNSFATINYSFKFNFLTACSAGWNSERDLGNEALEMTETKQQRKRLKRCLKGGIFMGTVYFELNSEKQNENFIQEIQEILIERYELEKGSSQWDEIFLN